MASRLGRRLLSLVVRPPIRASRGSTGASRRLMSTAQHSEPGSDKPWIIGSALFFGPLALWLLIPTVKKADDSSHGHNPSHGHVPSKTLVPVKDDEGTEVAAAEVQTTMQDAFNTDSPKDAEVAEEQATTEQVGPVADSEGEQVSDGEINSSTRQAIDQDSPKDVQRTEAEYAQAQTSETVHEQKGSEESSKDAPQDDTQKEAAAESKE
ncbi:hypothetical protein BKA93DRAFT_822505 [Sparassis latifolia]|uniref:Uncharacterized protein n=1 Tax=Sparassis crispa TaxID=139825 RepID=A0A401GMR8_9APHY|nr:hypothetical protein SCP_0500880 [Sparassis crispa]GBE83044.1 hypothetical protein SCP_0500880 [Sparassis crispa]